MKLPQIRLQSTFAQTEINIIKSNLEIEQPSAELSIQQPNPDLELRRTPSKLTIDQTKAREDVDLKSMSKRIQDAAEQGYEDWLSGLARVSQDGDELMRIENGKKAIAHQAKRNSEAPMLEFNIGWIPSAGGVQIDYDPGNVEINWNVNKPIIESKRNSPMIHYTPGQAEVSLKSYATLKIDFEYLTSVGKNYEETI